MAEAPSLFECRYAIDGGDHLVALDDPWLAFARENGAPELTRERVLQRPLWDFVCGVATRELYEALFGRVRSEGKGASVPFRCDGPDRFRFMRLELVPSPGGVIALRSVLLREQPRRPIALLDRALQRTEYHFPICSLCKRVFAFGAWLELEEAVERLGTFNSSLPPRLDEEVCERCRRLAAEAGGSPGSVP